MQTSLLVLGGLLASSSLLLGPLACGSPSDVDAATVTAGPGGSSGSGGANGSGPATGSGGGGGQAAPTPVARAFAMLDGRFDSKDQAAKDPQYYAVQIRACVVEAKELGPRVLYVEQALMTKLGAPYRQRLYVLEADPASPDAVLSHVYDLVAPKAAVGLCDEPGPRAFGAKDAVLQQGCAVQLAWDGLAERFVGGTVGEACESTLNGASYASSEVTLHADGFATWDRGYDADGKQVWGAVKGAYEFVRRTPLSE